MILCPRFNIIRSTSKESLSHRQAGWWVTLGLRCKIFTLTGIKNSYKWLTSFQLWFCYQYICHKLKGKNLWFSKFFEFWKCGWGVVNLSANMHIFFSSTQMDSIFFFFFCCFILALSHTSAENTSHSFVLLHNTPSHGWTFKLFLSSLLLS